MGNTGNTESRQPQPVTPEKVKTPLEMPYNDFSAIKRGFPPDGCVRCDSDYIKGLQCPACYMKKFCFNCFFHPQHFYPVDFMCAKELSDFCWNCPFCKHEVHFYKSNIIARPINGVLPDCTICGSELCGDEYVVSDDREIGICKKCKLISLRTFM